MYIKSVRFSCITSLNTAIFVFSLFPIGTAPQSVRTYPAGSTRAVSFYADNVDVLLVADGSIEPATASTRLLAPLDGLDAPEELPIPEPFWCAMDEVIMVRDLLVTSLARLESAALATSVVVPTTSTYLHR
ncbi:hypothetical protein FRC12_012718 [Ceratobasidium sp. 428]|nr:hypothetical protein FRC12_012718 [Ceratobasidium sp. 428]